MQGKHGHAESLTPVVTKVAIKSVFSPFLYTFLTQRSPDGSQCSNIFLLAPLGELTGLRQLLIFWILVIKIPSASKISRTSLSVNRLSSPLVKTAFL